MNFYESEHKRAHQLIPAGAHTYSKADNQFPANAPRFISHGKGARCFDHYGHEFIDYGMGIFACSLGHAFPPIVESIKQRLDLGNIFTRPTTNEGELAERLCGLIPSAEMVKFAKNGSDVTSAAIRLARSYTQRPYIVRCHQHPFHSFNDWFIGSTSRPSGVPEAVRDLTLRFSYNDITSVESIFDQYVKQIACVILEPVAIEAPDKGFLEKLRDLCTRYGVVLIFDEIISGFRWHLGGAQSYFGVKPDLSTFGKGMSNGFACSALVGHRDIMSLGNMDGDVFLLSCTYGAELVGITAAQATIQFFIDHPVIDHFWNYGQRLMLGMKDILRDHSLDSFIEIQGYPCRPHIHFKPSNNIDPLVAKTYFMQEMMNFNVIIERICISYSHTDEDLSMTLTAFEESMVKFKDAMDDGSMREKISGTSVQPVFTR